MHPSAFTNRPALILGVAALLLLALTLTLDLASSRRSELAFGSRQIEQHDRMLAENVARSFDSVEVLLDEMRVSLQENGNWLHWSAAAGHQYLKERTTRSLPQIRNLIIFDAEGRQRHVSFANPAPAISVADRTYFQQLLGGAERAREGPVIGRNSLRPTYIMARRLSNSEGRFTGVLIVAVEPAYFERFCHNTRPYDEFEAAIVNAQGHIIAACRPLISGAGRQEMLADTDFRQTLARGEFAGTPIPATRSTIEGARYLLASEPVPGYPDLRVVSATPRHALVRGWRAHAWRIVLLALLTIAALAGAGLLIRRQLRQMAGLTLELKESQETLEERVLNATREVESRRQEAELLAQSKSRFFAAASHDLRQPLHALQLFVGDLARISDTPEQRALVQRIESAAQAMAGQLRSLLDLSRLDMATIVPERVPLEVDALFEQLATTFRPGAEMVGTRLLFQSRPATLETDPALLTRLLGNLIDNAIKFSPHGTVMVCARRRANAVRIEVRDNGRGIPLEHQQAIYDEFYQIDNIARDPGAGLGLGLAIAHRIARLLGANISLRSAPGRGTTFAITLPRRSGPRARPAAPTPPRLILIGSPVDLAADPAAAARLLENGAGIPIVLCRDRCQLTAETLALLQRHRGIVISASACDMPGIGAYHLCEPVKPARLRALLRSLH